MAWHWRVQSASDAAVDPNEGLPAAGETFSSQSAAESWLTSTYAELAGQGVRAVSLYEEDRLVYGPMSLAAD